MRCLRMILHVTMLSLIILLHFTAMVLMDLVGHWAFNKVMKRDFENTIGTIEKG